MSGWFQEVFFYTGQRATTKDVSHPGGAIGHFGRVMKMTPGQTMNKVYRAWGLGAVVGAVLVLVFAGCAVAPKETGDIVWPLPPEEPRIKYVRTFCCTTDFGRTGVAALADRLFGVEGRRMAKPYGITTDKDGKIYVTDTGHDVVWVFDETNKKVSFLGAGGFRTPTGIAVDNTGKIFVADSASQRVVALDGDGKIVMALGQKKGELGNPSGLAIDPATNRLYVSNTRLHKIKVYDATNGQFLFDIGQRGEAEGQFNFPTNIFVRHGKLYVTDTGNFRAQVFDLEGKFLSSIGEIGDTFGSFARPKGIGVDSEGHIYVTDAAFDNFQIFNEEGQLLLFVGQKGRRPGNFWIPAGLYVDEQDQIYVADQYNQRIQIFQFLGETYKARLAKDKKERQ